MNLIPTRGLFLTFTENLLFYKSTHNALYNILAGVQYVQEKKFPHMERRSLDHGGQSSSSLVPCLRSTVFMPFALPSPLHPLSCKEDIYLHTDNINTPAPPVRHSKVLILNYIYNLKCFRF
jgi:hypothetical protein